MLRREIYRSFYPSRSSSRLLSKNLSTSSTFEVTLQAFFLCLTILFCFFLFNLSLSSTNHAAPNVEVAISLGHGAVVANAINNENNNSTKQK